MSKERSKIEIGNIFKIGFLLLFTGAAIGAIIGVARFTWISSLDCANPRETSYKDWCDKNGGFYWPGSSLTVPKCEK